MAKIYRSTMPDIELHDVDLVSYVLSNPFNAPLNKLMYVDAISGKGYTLKQVYQRTRSLAHGLREQLGLRPHDVVAYVSPNSIDYAVICHAVIGCGAAVSPTSAALTVAELHAQLNTSQARYLIAHSSLIQTARKAAKGTSVQTIIQADGESAVDGTPTAHMLATSCPPSELSSIAPSEAEHRIAFICFSSGTSGPAKGVMITHKNVTSNIQQWQKHLTRENEQYQNAVAFLPFNHIYGLNLYVCTGLVKGSTIVVLPKFDLELYLSCVQKYRPDELPIVPPVALMLVKSPVVSKYDLSSIKFVTSAAAPLTAELGTALEAMFKNTYGTTVYCRQGWGLTETSPLVSGVPEDRMDKRFSVGCIAPNMECRFVDPETMQDARTNADGTTELAEIWVRGPNVVKGYYRNEEATRSSFHVDGADGKRWFRTGDIGTIDRDGFITICDRIKEMIKYKGLQVIPSELEGKLLEHEDVADAAVVGQWVDEQATELPVGFVVIRPGVRSKTKTKDDKTIIDGIHRWLNERVANHKRLRGGIRLVDAIPKSASGKILRKELRELLKEETKKKRNNARL